MSKKYTLMTRREYRTKLGCNVLEVLKLNVDTGMVELAVTLAVENLPKSLPLSK